jgi:hypothetical protein
MTFIVFATDLSYLVLFKQEDLSKDNTVRINGLVTSTFLTKTDVIHIDFRKTASQKYFYQSHYPKTPNVTRLKLEIVLELTIEFSLLK